ncbi:O-fucosyltransferase 27 [Sesamum angolense]|uniref:O-fucosyltransferase 27 n=1 Tax=Sesamum angolense TaxID=2727404 RepID=A0AAE2BPQ2_9LAMI|nr:O-fucosyltransferase 27 [Sesamum angolense]
MGHRLHQLPNSKTFRVNRKEIAKLLEEVGDNFYQANHTWITSVRRHLRRDLVDGLADELRGSKPLSFLSFPVPECSCLRGDPSEVSVSLNASSSSAHSLLHDVLGAMQHCPSWMDADVASPPKEKESEQDDVEEDEPDLPGSALLFRQSAGSNESGVELSNKEETQMEDQEELEGGERCLTTGCTLKTTSWNCSRDNMLSKIVCWRTDSLRCEDPWWYPLFGFREFLGHALS